MRIDAASGRSSEVSAEEYARQRLFADSVRDLANKPRSYCVVTYGCQMNAHDGEKLAGLLRSMDMVEADRDTADVVIFNTCCVRENAERRALGNIKWAAHRRAEHTGFLLGVCGCMAQEAGGSFEAANMFPEADFVFGTHNLHCLPEYMLRALTEPGRVSEVWDGAEACIAEEVPVRRNSRHRAFVNIMFGCNNYCSYCIVPYVRGRERSRAPEAILAESEALLKDGVQEIMLLGQNVNSYGHDLSSGCGAQLHLVRGGGAEPRASGCGAQPHLVRGGGAEPRANGETFARLLQKLDALGVPRIRFMTSHPKDMSDDLIAAMALGRGICKHIHLPVQSGSDAILRAMNRGYGGAQYLERVRALRSAIPGVGITSDIIVGFPGETDSDFEDTLALAEEARFDAAYTFIYSPRKGTRAAQLPGRVDPDISAARIQKLIETQERQTRRALESLVGTRQTVLADEISRRDKTQVSGKCDRAISVSLPGDAQYIGKFIDVVITSIGHNTLRGEAIDRNE